ncbi:methyltransferase domain-containing protein [Acetobacteraceae bacterium]|nr:methyltransferase domain-containing protein [Acetobacteraceae bacterium]
MIKKNQNKHFKNNKPKTTPDPARDAAWKALGYILGEREPLELALEKACAADMLPRDRSTAHWMIAGTLRHLGVLEEILKENLKKEPPFPVFRALLLGAAQILFLDVPSYAAVGSTVDLLRRQSFVPFTGLANAILRKIVREGESVLETLDQPRLDTPAWLWKSWGKRARVISESYYETAPLDITLKEGAKEPEGAERLPNGSYRFPAGTSVTEIEGFDAGSFWVQDAAASMIAPLLGDVKGMEVADICAAPGGKTAQLAASGAKVIALDRDAHRLERLKENMERLQLEVTCEQADALEWQPDHLLEAILLDAPCSATGTLRRHPDVLRLKRQQDVRALAEGQALFIEAAGRILKKGGKLLYAVCSLQDEEGPHQIEAALKKGGWKHIPFSKEELSFLPESLTKEGYFRTHPAMWQEKKGIDGFFAALLIKE